MKLKVYESENKVKEVVRYLRLAQSYEEGRVLLQVVDENGIQQTNIGRIGPDGIELFTVPEMYGFKRTDGKITVTRR